MKINVYRIDIAKRKTKEENKNVLKFGDSLNTQQTVSGSNGTLLTSYCLIVSYIHPALFFSKKIPDQLTKFVICIPPVTHFIIGVNPRSERVEATDPSWEKM